MKHDTKEIWAAAWQNQQNDLCAQRRLRSAWTSTHSDQSLLCAHWVAKDPWLLHADSKDWLDWADARRTDHCVGFVVRRLISDFIVWDVSHMGSLLKG